MPQKIAPRRKSRFTPLKTLFSPLLLIIRYKLYEAVMFDGDRFYSIIVEYNAIPSQYCVYYLCNLIIAQTPFFYILNSLLYDICSNHATFILRS